MALFHLSVTQTKRSAGQSAIASAAYRAGERLYSEYYGEYSDYTRKGGVICLAFEATLTDRQIDMLQELGYLPVTTRQYGEECANCPYTLDEREHGICRRCAVFKK